MGVDDIIGRVASKGGNLLDAAAAGNWATVASSLAAQAVGRVEIVSQVSPPIVVDPFAPAPPAPPGPNPLMSFVRPVVRVYDPEGGLLYEVAPYGRPSGNYFPWLVLAAVVAGFGFTGLVAWLGAFIGRRRA